MCSSNYLNMTNWQFVKWTVLSSKVLIHQCCNCFLIMTVLKKHDKAVTGNSENTINCWELQNLYL